MAARKKPFHTIRAGAIKAAIWLNQGSKGPFFATTFSRSFNYLLDGGTTMGMFDVPEKIIRKYGVSKENLARMGRARKYDLEFLTTTFNDDLIRAGRPFSVEQVYPIINRFGKADFEIAKRLEEEFRRFVILTLVKPGVPHAPPGAVDMYWHFFILHTEQYMDFCKKVWGNFQGDPKYRHHYPSTDETRPGMLQAYIDTLNLYEEVFGQPEPYKRPGVAPVKIWTDRSDTSGDSYSGVVNPPIQGESKRQ